MTWNAINWWLVIEGNKNLPIYFDFHHSLMTMSINFGFRSSCSMLSMHTCM